MQRCELIVKSNSKAQGNPYTSFFNITAELNTFSLYIAPFVLLLFTPSVIGIPQTKLAGENAPQE